MSGGNDQSFSGLFTGKTAWFAVNVSADVKHAWFTHGGEVETAEKADFVFSQRFEDEEMQQKLSQRQRHCKYPVAVFHPHFIQSVCAHKSLTCVPIAKYLVLPRALQLQLLRHFPAACASRTEL